MQFEIKLFYEFPFKGEIFELEGDYFKAKSDGEKLTIEITPVLSAETVEEFKKTMFFIEEIGKVWLDKVLTQVFEHKQSPAPVEEEEEKITDELKMEEEMDKVKLEEPFLSEQPIIEPQVKEEELQVKEPQVKEPQVKEKEREEQLSASDFKDIEPELLNFFETTSTNEIASQTEFREEKEEKQELILTENQETILKENNKAIKEEENLKSKEDLEEDLLKEVVGLKEEEGGEKSQAPFRKEEGGEEGGIPLDEFISEEDRKVLEEAFKDFQKR